MLVLATHRTPEADKFDQYITEKYWYFWIQNQSAAPLNNISAWQCYGTWFTVFEETDRKTQRS